MGFEGTLGWLYTAGTVEGALTMSNQQYALFPFRFFNLTGSLNMHLGYGLVQFRCKPSIFQFNISLGAANIFLDEVNATVYYRMKRLFGGSEFYDEIDPVGLTNLGAAFLLLDAGIKPVMRRPRNSSLLFGIQKAFVLPWGYEKLVHAVTETPAAPSSPENGLDKEMWRTILLSGLSFYLKLSW
ncbi:MAG: hypothetical protein LBP74_03915 [Treponema sp.]|jgi:hypothetical protein|nr:hypothetical protein [Treponema sp.]